MTLLVAFLLVSQVDPAPPDPPPEPTPAPQEAPSEAPPSEAPPSEAPSSQRAPPTTPAEAPVPPTSLAGPPTDAAIDAEATAPARRVGDPIPLTQREPTLKALSLFVGARYGLVGTGPTRFVDNIRFSVTDWLELHTALLPYPSTLMARGRIGSQQSAVGAFLFDAGLAYFDAGLRLVPDSGESQVGARFHLEGVVGYQKSFAERFAVSAFAHYRARLSLLPDDDQHAVATSVHLTYDLLDAIAVSGGLGFATTLGTPVRELGVSFVETDRPGMTHLLARDDGAQQSLTIPLTLTYGRVDSFDVDLFCTPRVWPQFGILFGAGLRFRIEPLWKS